MQLEKSLYICKPSTRDTKITGARHLDLCCATLGGSFQSRAVLSAETDSFLEIIQLQPVSVCIIVVE